jgi:hypothetical protein
MDVEVVHYEVNGFGFRVCQRQSDGNLSELKGRTTRRGEGEMTTGFRLYGAANIGRAATSVFVIASRFPPRFGRRGGMDCSHYLPLRHLIDCIEVIHAVDSVQVTLMYRVHSQVSRPALRVRFASPPTLTFVGRVG